MKMNKQQKKNLDGALAVLAADALDARRALKAGVTHAEMLQHASALASLATEIHKSIQLSFCASSTLERFAPDGGRGL